MGRLDAYHNVKYKRDKGAHEAKGSWRPIFIFDVSKEAFDLFFNSPYGYRGKFLVDPEAGRQANTQVVSRLAKRLVQLAGCDDPQVESSFASPHAKIWIEEGQHSPTTPDLLVQVLVPAWVSAAEVVDERLCNSDSTITSKEIDRIYGVRAPVGTRLKAMGAWVSQNGVLGVVPSKLARAEEIRAYGVS